MKIIVSDIPDIQKENLDKRKIEIADTIITKVSPVLDKENNSKIGLKQSLKNNIEELDKYILERKKKLENISEELKRKKRIKELLNLTSKLISKGLVYDEKLKNQTIVLLKIIDELSSDKIDLNLQNAKKLFNKRFNSWVSIS